MDLVAKTRLTEASNYEPLSPGGSPQLRRTYGAKRQFRQLERDAILSHGVTQGFQHHKPWRTAPYFLVSRHRGEEVLQS